MATRFPVSTLAGDMISLRSAMDRLLNESFVPGQMRSMFSEVANGSTSTRRATRSSSSRRCRA
jgi:hypothetical protein